ncbi:hypothetical protein PGT21_019439 [Puccinia graminis f. sp. tritici]|uniref:Uncharacterized protein n=1 Tax=Puccinia graminis f. sp. tritici TaxID=56615 RepID=A0A5B0QWH8_PUCGR|nr:hypothetical protein PGT21_019439 [Puccinia graminis f. sp. tritici]
MTVMAKLSVFLEEAGAEEIDAITITHALKRDADKSHETTSVRGMQVTRLKKMLIMACLKVINHLFERWR